MKSNTPIEVLELQEGDFHIFTTVFVGRNKLRLLIDTGASKTILSKTAAKKIKSLRLTHSEHTAAGLGTNEMQSWTTEIKSLRIGKLVIRNYICGVLDLSHVTNIYEQLGLEAFDGVLGCDLLVNHNMVIDFKKKSLVYYL